MAKCTWKIKLLGKNNHKHLSHNYSPYNRNTNGKVQMVNYQYLNGMQSKTPSIRLKIIILKKVSENTEFIQFTTINVKRIKTHLYEVQPKVLLAHFTSLKEVHLSFGENGLKN